MITGPLRLTVEHDRPFRVDSTHTPVPTVGPFGVEAVQKLGIGALRSILSVMKLRLKQRYRSLIVGAVGEHALPSVARFQPDLCSVRVADFSHSLGLARTKWLPANQARSACKAELLQVVLCSLIRPVTALIDRDATG